VDARVIAYQRHLALIIRAGQHLRYHVSAGLMFKDYTYEAILFDPVPLDGVRRLFHAT